MLNKYYLFKLLLLVSFSGICQIEDTVHLDNNVFLVVDTITVTRSIHNKMINDEALYPFFEKLRILELTKQGKLNIVHIGDSHIQADIITKTVRDSLQKRYGNAGRGFVFPHTLAKTNGSWDIHFASNNLWENYKNINPVATNPVGLGGMVLFTKNKECVIELQIKNPKNYFKEIKIITPYNQNMFDIATTSKSIKIQGNRPKEISHKIAKGEGLYGIAKKYHTTVEALKKNNKLTSNLIKAGATLKIPTNHTEFQMMQRFVFDTIALSKANAFHYYDSEIPLNKIYLLPKLNFENQFMNSTEFNDKTFSEYVLNGLVLENLDSGILYHNIGVNGARFSDYNKYPLFFEQLKVLEPDLIVVSLGTNESFDKMETLAFFNQVHLFIENIKNQTSEAVILLTTPPPSLFKRKYPNTFVADYSKILVDSTHGSFAVCDVYHVLGGIEELDKNVKAGFMANDKIHYSKSGYIFQGNFIHEAIVSAFDAYKKKYNTVIYNVVTEHN